MDFLEYIPEYKNTSNNLTLKLEGRNHRKKYRALINYNEGPKT